jgi:hypothetical protein
MGTVMYLPLTVNGQGIVEHCRACNDDHLLTRTFPEMPQILIDLLMEGKANLVEDNGRWTATLV